MKTLLIVGTLLVGMSGQAMSMGHPHNIFAARKQMRTKASAMIHKQNVSSTSSLQPLMQVNKMDLSKRLLTALASITPSRAY